MLLHMQKQQCLFSAFRTYPCFQSCTMPRLSLTLTRVFSRIWWSHVFLPPPPHTPLALIAMPSALQQTNCSTTFALWRAPPKQKIHIMLFCLYSSPPKQHDTPSNNESFHVSKLVIFRFLYWFEHASFSSSFFGRFLHSVMHACQISVSACKCYEPCYL